MSRKDDEVCLFGREGREVHVDFEKARKACTVSGDAAVTCETESDSEHMGQVSRVSIGVSRWAVLSFASADEVEVSSILWKYGSSAGKLHPGQKVMSCCRVIWYPLAMQKGIWFLQETHVISLLTTWVEQNGHSEVRDNVSSASSVSLSLTPADLRTRVSILRLNRGSMRERYSLRINITAYSIACFLYDAFVHWITTEVKMATRSAGEGERACRWRDSDTGDGVTYAMESGLYSRPHATTAEQPFDDRRDSSTPVSGGRVREGEQSEK